MAFSAAAERRLNNLVSEHERRAHEEWDRKDAERDREAAEQARRWAERRVELQSRYSDAFRGLNVETPMPDPDEPPGHFRRRLFDGLRRRLAPDHDLAEVRADELPTTALNNFETQMIAAALQEGANPSWANLPRDGSMVARQHIDPNTGHKETRFLGRRSFIADMSRPARKVLRIVNRADNSVLWGAPFSKGR